MDFEISKADSVREDTLAESAQAPETGLESENLPATTDLSAMEDGTNGGGKQHAGGSAGPDGRKKRRYITRHERIKKPMSREEARKRMDEMDLEKGDVPAMILAALLTFSPILLALIGILLFVSWFFTRAG